MKHKKRKNIDRGLTAESLSRFGMSLTHLFAWLSKRKKKKVTLTFTFPQLVHSQILEKSGFRCYLIKKWRLAPKLSSFLFILYTHDLLTLNNWILLALCEFLWVFNYFTVWWSLKVNREEQPGEGYVMFCYSHL